MSSSGRKSKNGLRAVGSVFWRQFCKYCSCTALHGYQYITEPGRPLIERFVWLLCHLCAMSVASVMVYATWSRYSDSPTVTAVETTHYPIWKVPFPAVTICEANQVTLSSAKRLAARLGEGNKELEKEYMASFVFFRDILKHSLVPFTNVSRLHGALKKTGLDIAEVMRELSPSCSDILETCMWKGQERPCSELFHRTKSDNGYCCSFNYAEPCVGKGCSANAKPPMAVPQYTSSVGNKFGLKLIVRYNQEERFVPFASTDALRVMVHGSLVYPNQWSAADTLVTRQKYIFIRVAAESSYSTDSVKKLPLKKSGCIFEDDKDVSNNDDDDGVGTFQQPVKRYIQDNCLMECRRTHILHLCGCQPYYYPSTDGVRYCDFSDLSCIHRYKVLLSRLKPPVEELVQQGKGDLHSWDGQEAMECSCPPQCNELTYRYETTSANLKMETFSQIKASTQDNHSIFYVFFGKMHGTRYKRDLLLSWETMLSNAGGLFGLFMGFSLLSVVELVYFFTVRLYFESRTQKKRKQSANRFKKWSAMLKRSKTWKVGAVKSISLKVPQRDDYGRNINQDSRTQNFVY